MKYMLIEVAERAIGVPKIFDSYEDAHQEMRKHFAKICGVPVSEVEAYLQANYGRSSMARITTGRFSRFVVMFAELFMRIKREIMLEEIKFYEVSVIFPNLNLWYTMTVKSNYIP